MGHLEDALEDVASERMRQEALFGEQNHHPAYWLALLGKQMGQLGERVVDREWAAKGADAPSPWHTATERMRTEAVQLAAVAVAMIEAIDRGELPSTLVTAKPQDPRRLARVLDHGHESIDYDLGGEG